MNHYRDEYFKVDLYNLKKISKFINENPNAEKVSVIRALDPYGVEMEIASICETKNLRNVVEKIKKEWGNDHEGFPIYDMTMEELKGGKKQIFNLIFEELEKIHKCDNIDDTIDGKGWGKALIDVLCGLDSYSEPDFSYLE